MKRVRGIVLEIAKNYLIIFTPQGDYEKVPHPGGKVNYGDELSFRLPSPVWPKVIAAAAVVLVLFTAFLLETPLQRLPWADKGVEGYLVMDINPALELTFDENLTVTSSVPLEEEAAALLEEDLRGKSLEEAIALLLRHSKDLGLISIQREDNLILATLVQGGGMEVSPSQIAKVIENRLSQLAISGYVGIFETDKHTREDSIKAGLSLNRYLLKQSLQQQGKEEMPPSLLQMVRALETSPPGSLFITAGEPEIPEPLIPDPSPPADPSPAPSLPPEDEEVPQKDKDPAPPSPGEPPGEAPEPPDGSKEKEQGEAPSSPR